MAKRRAQDEAIASAASRSSAGETAGRPHEQLEPRDVGRRRLGDGSHRGSKLGENVLDKRVHEHLFKKSRGVRPGAVALVLALGGGRLLLLVLGRSHGDLGAEAAADAH